MIAPMLIAISAWASLLVQTPDKTPSPVVRLSQTPRAYWAIVDSYRRGERRSAVVAIATWGEKELGTAVGVEKWPAIEELIRAAMLMHFEREMADRDRAAAVGGGQVDCSVGFHGAIVEYLLDLVAKKDSERDFVAGFAELSSIRYRSMHCYPHARYWAEVGLKARPRVANLLVARGMIDDMLAREGERAWYPAPELGRWGRHLSVADAIDRGQRRHDARKALEAALAIEPAHCEAALRLGRLLLDSNQRGLASRPLASATSGCPPRVAYLAWLFLGRISEDDGDSKTAIDAFESARRILPAAQSAAIALAHAAADSGDDERARETLERSIALAGRRDALDPLATYLMGDIDVLPLFSALFAACGK